MVNRKRDRIVPSTLSQILLSSLLVFSQMGWADLQEPWLGNYLEFEWDSSFEGQRYTKISEGSHGHSSPTTSLFLISDLGIALRPDFSMDLGVMAANTPYQTGRIDNFHLNGRYVWLDDIAGDVMTLTTGVDITQAFHWSVKDPSSFHHGNFASDFFISLGKEQSFYDTWVSRGWATFGLGVADHGEPWLHFNIAMDNKFCHNHLLTVFLRGMRGLGKKSLELDHFHGYGSIAHQSIDLGIRYGYEIECEGTLWIECQYRSYARNFPVQARHICLGIHYPFGL